MAIENFRSVARVGEIPEGEGRFFEVGDRMVAVFLASGNYYALEDSCPHQGAPLSDGAICDKAVTCTWHGWRFSLEDGKWLDNPRGQVKVDTFPVRVVGDEVQVAID